MVMNSIKDSLDYSKDPSNNLAFQILIRIGNMQDAKAREDWVAFYWNFDSATKLCSNSHNVKTKIYLQNEFNKLNAGIQHIKKDNNMSKTSKLLEILELRTTFALSNEIFIMRALPEMDIVKHKETGLLDFSNDNLQLLEKIIRSNTGITDAGTKLKESADEDAYEDESELIPEIEENKEVE